MHIIKQKDFDKPWKVTIWLLGIDAIMRLPLRFFKSYFLYNLGLFSIVRFIVFLFAVFLTGYIYVKVTKKIIDKSLRFKVAFYTASISLIGWLILSLIVGEVFSQMFGGIIEGIMSVVITFLACYFILPISNKFVREKKQ